MLFMYSEGRWFYIKIADRFLLVGNDRYAKIYTIIGEIHGHCKRLSCQFMVKYFGSEKLEA